MIAKEKKVPLRSLPQYFLNAKKKRVGRFILYFQPSLVDFSRFSCIVSSQKHPCTSVQRTAIKRALYSCAQKVLATKLVYNLDIVCVAFYSPTDQELQTIGHELSLLTVSSAENVQA